MCVSVMNVERGSQTAEQLRHVSEQLDQRESPLTVGRRAEDRYREELRDARAKVINRDPDEDRPRSASPDFGDAESPQERLRQRMDDLWRDARALRVLIEQAGR